MRAHITCHLSNSEERFSLGIGDLIGRSEQAALCLDDPRISEAHALLSLRGGALVLLALRGRFRHRGQVIAELELRPGMAIELYKNFWLHCDEVFVPGKLMGLEIPGLATTTLTHTSSLFFDHDTERFSLQHGHIAQADAVFWSLSDTWSYRKKDGITHELEPGDVIEIKGAMIRCVQIPLDDVGVLRTRQVRRPPLRLEVFDKGVKISANVHERAAMLSGIPGKILASISTCEHPVPWQQIARLVWLEDRSYESALRRRFDVGLLRLRDKLQQLDLPHDIVRMDGSGLVGIFLEPEDQIVHIGHAS